MERQNVGLFDGSNGVQFAQIVAKEPYAKIKHRRMGDSVFAVADLDLVDSLCYSTIILSWVSIVLYGALASPLLHSCVVQESL